VGGHSAPTARWIRPVTDAPLSWSSSVINLDATQL